MEDIQLTCKICGAGFLFSVNEQVFYRSRVLDNPKRCPDCRAKRRQEMYRADTMKCKEMNDGQILQSPQQHL